VVFGGNKPFEVTFAKHFPVDQPIPDRGKRRATYVAEDGPEVV
jgi:hypothetical protein